MTYDTFLDLEPQQLLWAIEGYYENSIGGLTLMALGGKKTHDPKTFKGRNKIKADIDKLFGDKEE